MSSIHKSVHVGVEEAEFEQARDPKEREIKLWQHYCVSLVDDTKLAIIWKLAKNNCVCRKQNVETKYNSNPRPITK